MNHVFIHPLAEKDIDDVIIYYNLQSADLGNRLLSEVELAIEALKSNPVTFRKRYGAKRICKTGKIFLYYAHFELNSK